MASKTRVCQHCGGNDIDTDPARGDAVCTGCGSVLEDQIIVSEVQFMENAMGGSSVIGQYVSTDGTSKGMSIGSGFHHGYGKESRAITLQNGKRRIHHLGDQLRLSQHCIDMAFSFFKMAVSKRLTRGRKTMHISAACLYIVCRKEATPHMLLDFSDIVQANVYILGRAYLQLARELCISIPLLDPCLYLERFASKMEFGDKKHVVCLTANRLLQRMKRDWLSEGRRPSGLCGAAILVAARLHNFNRTIKEVISVVKIGETTIRKRLSEFEKTPSSQLTIDEFQKIDLEEEMDPPCFTEGKRRARIAQLENKNIGDFAVEITDLEVQIEKALEDSAQRKRKRKCDDAQSYCSTSTNHTAVDFDMNHTDMDNKSILHSALVRNAVPGYTPPGDVTADEATSVIPTDLCSESSGIPPGNANNEVTIDDIIASNSNNPSLKTMSGVTPGEEGIVAALEKEALDHILSVQNSDVYNSGPRPTAASLGIKESVDECLEDDDGWEDDKSMLNEDGTLYIDDINDEELDMYILSKEEVIVKTKIWVRANVDYLREMKVKQEQELADDVKQEPTKKKRNRRKRGPQKEAHSAAEALEKMLQEKKISSKINYDVLRDLNKTVSKTIGIKEEPMSLGGVAIADMKPIIESGPVISRFKKPAVPHDVPMFGEPSSKRLKTSVTPTLKPPTKDSTSTRTHKEDPPARPLQTPEEPAELLVESGPVEYSAADLEEDYDDSDDDDDHVSAAQLMRDTYGSEDYGDDDEEILD